MAFALHGFCVAPFAFAAGFSDALPTLFDEPSRTGADLAIPVLAGRTGDLLAGMAASGGLGPGSFRAVAFAAAQVSVGALNVALTPLGYCVALLTFAAGLWRFGASFSVPVETLGADAVFTVPDLAADAADAVHAVPMLSGRAGDRLAVEAAGGGLGAGALGADAFAAAQQAVTAIDMTLALLGLGVTPFACAARY